jgi:hypothetical protein
LLPAVLGLYLCLPAALALAESAPPEAPRADAAAPAGAQAVARVVFAILSYARWPIDQEPLRLCVLQPNRYGQRLGLGQAREYGAARQIQVREMDVDNPIVAVDCDAIYTGALDAQQKQTLYGRLAGHSVLSISESDRECAVGPMFCLNVSDHGISFKVNLDSVARSGVRVHPNVLQLGRSKAGTP